MRMHWQRTWILMLAFAAGLSGCRRAEVAADHEVSNEVHLGDKTDIDLAEWLNLSRVDLAKKVAETRDAALTLRDQWKTKEPALLSKLRPPIVSPVLRAATFSAKRKISLPPYVKDGTDDAGLALHLARYGDVEAALVIADPADKELRQRIEACRLERNYPVEWTQLVGLHLHLAEINLANDNPDGPTELVLLHKQLLALFDKKAASGPLGATLLPIGRRALAEAVHAWRDDKNKKLLLADDVETALKDWGTVPTPAPVVVPGAKRETVAQRMGVNGTGRTLVAATEGAIQRTVDLLDLPILEEGVQNVVAFLDGDGQLVEFLFAYKDGTVANFPEPVNFGHHLADRDFARSKATDNSLSFTGGGLRYDVMTLRRSRAISGLIRVGAEQAPPAAFLNRDPRDFGPLHLDRSFETNRRALAPDLPSKKTIPINRPAALARIVLPGIDEKLETVVIERQGDQDLIASLQFHWRNEGALNQVAGTRLAIPLWAAFGPARVEDVEGTKNDHLALIWENETTRLTLRMPYNPTDAPELIAVDRRDETTAKERVAAATKFENAERDERWNHSGWFTTDKRVIRLQRQLPIAGLESLQLGQSKAEVHKLLTAKSEFRLKNMADGGFNLLLLSSPPAGVTFWPRQVFVRFDKNDGIVEVRVRYQGGTVPPSKDRPALFDLLKRNNGGAPEKLESTWESVWRDLPPGSSEYFRWRDDLTLVTFQGDAFTTEVTLRDCPKDTPRGVEVPLAFCARGVAGCELGNKRSEVYKRWKIAQPTMVGDAVLLSPAEGPFDAVLATFEDGDEGKATKIIGQYRKRLLAPDATQAILDAWGADVDHLGMIRRQDQPSKGLLHASSWHDDLTRVRIFGQETATGPRLYCEWRELPIPKPASSTAKR